MPNIISKRDGAHFQCTTAQSIEDVKVYIYYRCTGENDEKEKDVQFSYDKH